MSCMQFFSKMVVFQEVPDEISLSFSIAGCPFNCEGCSWKNSSVFKKLKPKPLDDSLYQQYLNKYKNYVSCVCFLGGEWEQSDLINKLKIAKNNKLKTCLYTGKTLESVDSDIIKNLDYIKVGAYNKKLGGLKCKTTNQKMYDLNKKVCINDKFQKEDLKKGKL